MRVFQRGDNWYVDYSVKGRRKRKKIGLNKNLAETVLAKIRVQIIEGKYLDITREQKVPFEDFATEYFEFSKVNKRSWTRDRTSIKHLKVAFSRKYLYEITPLEIEHYKAKRKDEVMPASVNRELACLKHMFTKALEWGKATENPAKKVKLLRENNTRLRYLTSEEAKRLIDAAAPHLKPIVIVALHTGARKGEILGLRWENIHWKRRVILLTDTKNGQWREIPMNGTVTETLRNLLKRSKGPSVFTSWTGKPFTNVRKSFDSALKKAEIEDFRFHDLRHSFASHLVMAGVDLTTVKELLGHKSIEMTMRYSHLSPAHKKQAVERLEKEIGTRLTPSSDSIEKALS